MKLDGPTSTAGVNPEVLKPLAGLVCFQILYSILLQFYYRSAE